MDSGILMIQDSILVCSPDPRILHTAPEDKRTKLHKLLFAFNKGDLYDLEVGLYVKRMAASLCVEKVVIDSEAVRKTIEHLFALLGLILFVVNRVSLAFLVFLESPLISSIRASINKLLDLHWLAPHPNHLHRFCNNDTGPISCKSSFVMLFVVDIKDGLLDFKLGDKGVIHVNFRYNSEMHPLWIHPPFFGVQITLS
jgi:hypothetical protein